MTNPTEGENLKKMAGKFRTVEVMPSAVPEGEPNCTHAHCKCMNLGKQCPNFHYADCIKQKQIPEGEKESRDIFFNELAEKLDELFPKGECKERSAALVLNAEANILFEKHIKALEARKDGEKDMACMKAFKLGQEDKEAELTTFKNSVRDYLKENRHKVERSDRYVLDKLENLLDSELLR